jgi:SAM-dependent methyltransferase
VSSVSPRAARFEAAWSVVADAADVALGTSLLDLGCGSGGFCAFAAGRGAAVHGLDVDPEAIGEALEAVPGADLRLGLMEQLPWHAASFDVVTSFNALQYALDAELALAEASRVVRPGGRIAICKWGPPSQNEFFEFLLAVGANGVRGGALPATDPFEDALRAARLVVIAEGHASAPIEMSGEAALMSALARAAIEPDPHTSAGGADLTAAAAPFRQADGSYRFENRLRYWIARPPVARLSAHDPRLRL